MATDQHNTADETLDILKRLEPLLGRIGSDVAVLKADVAGLRADMTRLDDRVRVIGQDVANLQGRISQLPTSWVMFTAIAVLIFTVMGGSFGILAAARAVL